MKLFASLTSPYARKIRIQLAEKNIPFELVVDSPWESNTRIPEVNPLGKVPVLETDDGETFFDSPVVAAYIETLSAAPRLVPYDPLESIRVRQFEALADGISDAAVAAFLENKRPEAKRDEAVVARQLRKVELGLDSLEKVAIGRTWLHGDNMSLADIATGATVCFLDLRLPQLNWRDGRPGLAALTERLLTRQSFIDTTPPAG